MNSFTTPDRALISRRPTDMRAGMQRLASIVVADFGCDPQDGALRCFVSRDCEKMKMMAAQNEALAKENAKLASDMARAAAESAEAVSALKSQLADARATIDSMIEQIKLAAQHRFGSSSEKVIPE